MELAERFLRSPGCHTGTRGRGLPSGKKPGAGQAWRSWQRNEIRWRGLRSNFVDRLHEVAAPTLILHGAEDKYVPVAWARRAHTMIKDSELHVLPQCGHWLTLEKPGEFNRALSEFLLAE